jgi:alcohol dehydrogenase YqhD (iron-dependent ADH family)
MYDFEFHNPTKIIFGKEKETLIGSELANADIKKVLFLYGRESIKKSGLYDRVGSNMQEHGIDFIEFPGVVSNPLLSHTREGIIIAKHENVDAILAVGGGSVLDEAKAIAVGALTDRDIWDYYLGKQEVTEALPVFTVLTLAATGSEMNGNSVISNADRQQKYSITSPHIYPRVSILNPELTCTVPPDYSTYGAVDAIAHVIEAYFTKMPGTRLQDRLVEAIIKTVIETHNRIMDDPNDYDARSSFMWTATLALNGLTPAGVGEYGFPNHMIEHSLSAIYNIAHGAGLSIVIPAWMRWYSSQNPTQFERFAKEVFDKDTGEQGIIELENWFASINSPTRLSHVNIPAEDIDRIAANASGLAALWGLGEIYTQETITEILNLAV